jgi:hypothetical protein
MQGFRVGSSVAGINEEVQHGTVMPNAVAARRRPRQQVGRHPGDPVGVLAESAARQAQSDLGNVEHRQTGVSGGQQRPG